MIFSCAPILLNNVIKSCFSNTKYTDTIQSDTTQIDNITFHVKRRVLIKNKYIYFVTNINI